MQEIPLLLGERSYTISIKDGLTDEAGRLVSGRFSDKKICIIADETALTLHGDRLLTGFVGHAEAPQIIPITPGEGSKSLATAEKLYHRLFQMNFKRGDVILAFGGGVVCDLAGFVAATYMRGTQLVQMPTTLLAQIDASVGGKVAVNLPEGKNLVGSFYQPSMVLIDPLLLQTLDLRELRAGLCEAIKYAAIGCTQLFELLEQIDLTKKISEQLIALCCRFKAEIVGQDERDTGRRMLLNFGHTFGHAIEKQYQFTRFNHGEAVGIGMLLAARLGEILGSTKPGNMAALKALLVRGGCPIDLPDDAQKILPLLAGDKKNEGQEITLVLLEDLGRPVIKSMTLPAIQQAFSTAGEGSA